MPNPSTTPTPAIAPSGQLVYLEPMLDKAAIADFFSCSERWIEERMNEGMPHRVLGRRTKFRASECEPWLEQHGYIERRGEAA